MYGYLQNPDNIWLQVCLHLQNTGYKPGLFVPAHPTVPGGEWKTGGIGPLEDFIRRTNYYTCVDDDV